jgi:hypothetical protein
MTISRDVRALLHDGKGSRIDAPVIHRDGAGTALAVVTALLGAGEVEIKAKRVEQCSLRRDRRFAFDAATWRRIADHWTA